MTKVQAFFIVAILSAINGYPLEESSSPPPSNDAKLHDLKVNPLLSGQIQKQNNNASSKDEDSKDDDNSTNPSFIEETFIEVLLPGTPQLNSSVLESILKSTSAVNDTLETHRPKRASPKNENAPTSVKEERPSSTSRTVVPALYSQQKYQARPVRDTSSENDDASSEENSKSSSHEDSSSDENSSEEKEVRPQITTAHLPSTSQNSANRVYRDTSEGDSKSSNKNVPPRVLDTSGKSTVPPVLHNFKRDAAENERKENSPKPGSTTESAVFVTPQAKKLQ